jgi:hypothetical protein
VWREGSLKIEELPYKSYFLRSQLYMVQKSLKFDVKSMCVDRSVLTHLSQTKLNTNLCSQGKGNQLRPERLRSH